MVFVKGFCIGAQMVARKADALPEHVSSFPIAILLEIDFAGAVNPLLSSSQLRQSFQLWNRRRMGLRGPHCNIIVELARPWTKIV